MTVKVKLATALVAGLMFSLLAAPAEARQKHRASNSYAALAARGECPTNLGCGCHLADAFGGIAKFGKKLWRDLWVARAWARVGSPAAPGCVGCVAVLSRGGGGHVGKVTSWNGPNPVIYSYANARLGWTTTEYSARRLLALRNVDGAVSLTLNTQASSHFIEPN